MNPTAGAAVLLIHGNHRLLVEEELKKVRSRISEAGEDELILDVFEAGSDSLDDVLRAAETLL